MASIRQLYVSLSLRADDFNNQIRAAQKEAKEFEKTIKPTSQLLKDLGSAAVSAGQVLSVAFTAPILAIGGVGVAFNAMQEQAHIAFTTMLGDGQKAATFLAELKDFAAKTPFEFPDLVRAAQRLIAMGFAATEVKPLLTAVGNAVAALGGGAAEIDRVTLALGQMQGRGRVATQEMNQLTEVGINAWQILASNMGIAESKLRDLVEKGAVPANQAIKILVDTMNSDTRFAGMIEKQAQSFKGLVSTIKDESRFLAGELTEGLFNALKGPAETLSSFLHELRMNMGGWSAETKALIAVMAGLLAALGPVLFILGTMAGSVSNMIVLYAKLIPVIQSSTIAMGAFNAVMAAAPWVIVAAGITSVLVLLHDLEATYRNNKEAAQEFTAATDQSNKNLDKQIAFLKEQGITIDKTGKSQEKLTQEVALATRGYMSWTDSMKKTKGSIEGVTVDLTKHTVVVKKAIALTEDQVKAQNKFREEVDKMKQAVMGDADATRVLITAIRDMERAQIPAEAITKKLAGQIREEYDNAMLLRQNMDPLILKYYGLATAQERATRTLEDISREFEAANQMVVDGTRYINQFNVAMADMSDRTVKAIDPQIAAIAGLSGVLDEVAESAERTRKIQEIATESGAKHAEEAAIRRQRVEEDAAKRTQDVWIHAMGNVTSDLAKGLADVLLSGKNFGEMMINIAKNTARSMLEAFLSGLLAPLTTKLAELGSSIAGALGKKGGILGGIFGGGAAAGGVAVPTAGGAGGTAAAGGVMGALTSATGLAAMGAGLGALLVTKLFPSDPFPLLQLGAPGSEYSKRFLGLRESGISEDIFNELALGGMGGKEIVDFLSRPDINAAALSGASAQELTSGSTVTNNTNNFTIVQTPDQDTSQIVNEIIRYLQSNSGAAQQFSEALPSLSF